jgi:hypothetical protein
MLSGMRKAASLAAAVTASAAVLILGTLWLGRAALPYNEEGRFFDATHSVVYTDSAVLTYGLLTALSGLAAVAAAIWARREWRG